MVDAVVGVRVVLLDVCGPQEAHHGFGWSSSENCIFFYADDDQIAERNPIWVQMNMTDMVRMFDRVELKINIGKTKVMLCTSGLIWGYQGTAAYTRRATGEGARSEENQGKLQGVRGGAMAASSLHNHTERTYGIVLPQNRGVHVSRGGPETYRVYFSWVIKLVAFPVDG